MTAQTTPKRGAWEDKFREPTADELLKAITTPDGETMIRDLRGRLLALDGVAEKREWQGIPWRWTLVYSCAMDPTRAFAYLVPEPGRPQLAVPLTVAMVQSLPLKRMKKAIRDGVLFSRFVAGVYWPSWTLDTASQLDELAEIFQRKYRGVAGEWGGSPSAGGGIGGSAGGSGGGGGGAGGGGGTDKSGARKATDAER